MVRRSAIGLTAVPLEERMMWYYRLLTFWIGLVMVADVFIRHGIITHPTLIALNDGMARLAYPIGATLLIGFGVLARPAAPESPPSGREDLPTLPEVVDSPQERRPSTFKPGDGSERREG